MKIITSGILTVTLVALVITAAAQESGYPPQRGIPAGDTTSKRLGAVRRDINAALVNLNKAPKDIHGGFVEKAIADAIHALSDLTKGLDYIAAHPESDSTGSWPNGGAMPSPLPQLPGSGQGADPSLFAAYNNLRTAFFDFLTGSEVHPYQIGEIGGNRDTIRTDISKAASDLIAGLDYARSQPASATSGKAELIINGDFETPSAPVNGSNANNNLIVKTSDGGEPAGFGWRVRSGSAFAPAGPVVLREGYTNTVQGRTMAFGGSAAEGHQWLDLVGGGSGSTTGSSISQIIATTAGRAYTLSFAYANSPYPASPQSGRTTPHPFSATVTVKDTANDTDLTAPQTFAHETSTATDYHWDQSAVTFTAQSSRTTIQFKAGYISGGFDGMFLDSISVKPAAPKP